MTHYKTPSDQSVLDAQLAAARAQRTGDAAIINVKKLTRIARGAVGAALSIVDTSEDSSALSAPSGGVDRLAKDKDVSLSSLTDDDILVYDSTTGKWVNQGFPVFIQKDCLDETTALSVATVKTFRVPHAISLSEIRASLTTAQATNGAGGILTIDVSQNGVSVFSTTLTIDNTETTSTTAATPAVLSATTLYDDDEMTIDVTQIGDGTAAGLKVTLIGTLSNATSAGSGTAWLGAYVSGWLDAWL